MMHPDKCDKSHKPHEVDVWFPPHYRQPYVEYLIGISVDTTLPAFTPSRADYFVRLWGYGQIQQDPKAAPIEFLNSDIRPFRCSHREAADLFYGKDQKEERSAGNMLNEFRRMRFARRKSFQGAKNRSIVTLDNLERLVLPNHKESEEHHQKNKIYVDQFNSRNDRGDVAPFIEDLYALDPNLSKSDDVQRSIEGGLKAWSKRYPHGMRVMRQKNKETGKPEETIGLVAVFPVHVEESEDVFYKSPRSSFYLGTFIKGMEDPIKYAKKGDSCESACIRCWQLRRDQWTFENALMLFTETQNILRKMYQEHSDLENVYSIPIHETLKEFALSIGFKLKRTKNPQDLYWLHIALDRFLEIDGKKALNNFNFEKVRF